MRLLAITQFGFEVWLFFSCATWWNSRFVCRCHRVKQPRFGNTILPGFSKTVQHWLNHVYNTCQSLRNVEDAIQSLQRILNILGFDGRCTAGPYGPNLLCVLGRRCRFEESIWALHRSLRCPRSNSRRKFQVKAFEKFVVLRSNPLTRSCYLDHRCFAGLRKTPSICRLAASFDCLKNAVVFG